MVDRPLRSMRLKMPVKKKNMFKFFKKKSEKEKLYDLYDKLLAESYKYSTIDRAKSDTLAAEAQAVLDKIDSMDI